MKKKIFISKYKAILSIILISIILTSCSNPNTPAGHEGYVFEEPRIFGKGGFRGIVKGPGNYGMSFWRNKIINIDIRPSTYNEDLKILAKDDLNVTFHFHAVIGITPGNVKEIVQSFGGEDWYIRYIQKPFKTFIRNSVQHYTSREIKANRDIIASEIKKKLSQYLEKTPFNLISLVVGNIDYPKIVTQAVEKKLAAQQLLEEKKVQKEIAQQNAQIKIEEAKGIAEAQKIINETLTTNYLQHEAIMAQEQMANSPNHTTVYIPVGPNGMPIVYTPKK